MKRRIFLVFFDLVHDNSQNKDKFDVINTSFENTIEYDEGRQTMQK